MSELLSSRAGIYAVDWPLGRITLNSERIQFEILLRTVELRLTEVKFVRKRWFSMEIVHRSPDLPSSVKVWGINLYRRLERVVKENGLEIQMQ